MNNKGKMNKQTFGEDQKRNGDLIT
jgi:hypothetical protein